MTDTTANIKTESGAGDRKPVVHGMWVGSRLSNLELLTLHSFVHYGHELHLWAYDEIRTPLPEGVVLEDASRIIPRKDVFKKKSADPETGVGKGSFGAPFSDLFRYKLLYELGGWWVDMDVTCLRPFDFDDDYVFRTHGVGVVGNIMKCPRGSNLMRETYEAVLRGANEHSDWLMPNRILADNVRRLDLERFIKPDICNEDSWWYAVKPFVEGPAPIPFNWYAIHWVNEFWRTLAEENGVYKGEKLLDYIPSKETPRSGSTQEILYRRYGLIDSASRPQAPTKTVSRPVAAPEQRTRILTSAPRSEKLHINILVPSLTRGGAERSVVDTLQYLKGSNVTAKLFVLYNAPQPYAVHGMEHVEVVSLAGEVDEQRKLRRAALEILASPSTVVYTHLVAADRLRLLWDLGVKTIPVIQNSQPSWQNAPSVFDTPSVPMVVAVSDAVADQLRAAGCPRPVVTIRHEIPRRPSPAELQRNREAIRGQYGIRDDVVLIGMVGQFKTQKAYTRAVRVLHALQQVYPASKLMILGGWDHAHGAGRAAYTATCRQALDLGVMPDLIMPGNVDPVEPYYAAFDIFLNTSIYEGLSVSMLEAAAHGCPIVTADAGGNREALPPSGALITDAANVESYVEAIIRILGESWRVIPPAPPDAQLVPKLWTLMARYGLPDVDAGRSGTLFLTDNLNFGGPQRSLTNLLCHLPASHKSFLGIVDRGYRPEFANEIERAQVPVFEMRHGLSPIDKVAEICGWIDAFKVRSVCFWNVDARVKLLLAKVLEASAIRIVDVSPGPMLFDDLAGTRSLQTRAAFAVDQYFRRLDCFVAKYANGLEPFMSTELAPFMSTELARPRSLAVIRNGVPLVDSDETEPEVRSGFTVGTCCRIVPAKRIEFLIAAMALVTRRVPEAKLVIAGSVDPRYVRYWNSIVDKIEETGLTNIRFVPAQADVRPILREFDVFAMISDSQGCPNASLEAMAMGLPVVANASGGTPEQVRDSVNGYLVDDRDPAEMAARIEYLLTHPKKRLAMGEASRKIAADEFSMQSMVDCYMSLLDERYAG